MRQGQETRITKETSIEVFVELDSSIQPQISTGAPFFDHMLLQLAYHGACNLQIQAHGDQEIDDHHLVEDTGITLGLAFRKALGEREGITRYGSARIPMDETLVVADIDLTTRPYLHYDLALQREWVGNFDTSLPLEFWRAFTYNCGCNLHITRVRGGNAHHLIEASFKATARALRQAFSFDERRHDGRATSTKGLL